jgi:ABC-type nitrate/sulfonate/bicarbonate transport system permease component
MSLPPLAVRRRLDDFVPQLIAASAARQSAAQVQKLAAMQRSVRIPDMFAGIFTLGGVGFIIDFAILKIERHFVRWRGARVET